MQCPEQDPTRPLQPNVLRFRPAGGAIREISDYIIEAVLTA